MRLGAGAAGIKYEGRDDVLMAVMAPGTTVAGVFTTSKTASAPVDWCRAALAQKSAPALIVNSGNANAFTGRKAASRPLAPTAEAAAAVAGCRPQEVFLASTGVIGEPLPVKKITSVLPDIYENTGATAWDQAARAIMTTDTFAKMATATAHDRRRKRVRINGIAKGSGMIAPDMATMLSFVFTDAAIPPDVLQPLLTQATETSFNAITVDGDTSTSDTLLLFATGKGARHNPITRLDRQAPRRLPPQTDSPAARPRGPSRARRRRRDQTHPRQRQRRRDHQQPHARSRSPIANSPLVKTAIAGDDANWGRVVMAVGKAGEAANRDKLSIKFGDHRVATQGQRDPNYSEALMSRYMLRAEIEIDIDVGIAKGAFGVWTCDLTHGYICDQRRLSQLSLRRHVPHGTVVARSPSQPAAPPRACPMQPSSPGDAGGVPEWCDDEIAELLLSR